MGLTMSPMTASIMSAVPPRRAGVGSAMNDATRELGTALGVAILGSLAAWRYSSSLSSALPALRARTGPGRRGHVVARRRASGRRRACRRPAAQALTLDAQRAFISGIHLAVAVGAVLALVALVAVLR